ncbi:hypothetical protein AOQ84DRAFT_380786 [Glonium stellatum]|uniref:Uncharacterized protein n=1 Tax=Glonium stellatum TaxID=574774 RepID=A0A8E2ETA8_9PEZI|nr:hypothetical protein AOQ84DRAFT_380786 [Glonium stellatum]
MIKHVPSDEASSQRKKRLQQKVSNAAQTFLAKNALLRDQNKSLTKFNDEGKARRSAKSAILGKAKVIRWEDLEKAQAEHAVKEAMKAKKEAKKAAKGAKRVACAALRAKKATAGKQKRGRKQKSNTIWANAPELKTKVARISEARAKEDEVMLEP